MSKWNRKGEPIDFYSKVPEAKEYIRGFLEPFIDLAGKDWVEVRVEAWYKVFSDDSREWHREELDRNMAVWMLRYLPSLIVEAVPKAVAAAIEASNKPE